VSDDPKESVEPEVIDLNRRVAELFGAAISVEPPEPMRARLEREKTQLAQQLEQERLDRDEQRRTQREEAAHRRRVFWVVFALVVLVGVISLWVALFDSNASAETTAWARTTASAIIAGIVGYFTGAAIAK
jgi:cation transport ATPase